MQNETTIGAFSLKEGPGEASGEKIARGVNEKLVGNLAVYIDR